MAGSWVCRACFWVLLVLAPPAQAATKAWPWDWLTAGSPPDETERPPVRSG
eukprot:CAMPEP_0179372460 /NCGR_PEP_ID=MMETSP0797-20121207/86297_1 /TAXON_ID=47934 /ORGANISM="Dinophysis acuminata, Strain DAEP01" /LENGTH=50 /DNA_ID=CAMNT_0021088433 /DNA_START=47 /DNA_END=195 /DNA_ORIENTATION=+